MKKYCFLLMLLAVVAGCEDKEEEGLRPVVRYHDCSLWDYLQQTEEFDSLAVMIRRAGLEDLYAGRDAAHPSVSVFAPTNLNMVIYLQQTTGPDGERLYRRIADVPEQTCRDIVLSYTIDGKHRKADFGFEVAGTLTGGTEVENLLGDTVRIYRIKTDFYGTADVGIPLLALHFKQSGAMADVESADQETQNGMVHSLAYTTLVMNPNEE